MNHSTRSSLCSRLRGIAISRDVLALEHILTYALFPPPQAGICVSLHKMRSLTGVLNSLQAAKDVVRWRAWCLDHWICSPNNQKQSPQSRVKKTRTQRRVACGLELVTNSKYLLSQCKETFTDFSALQEVRCSLRCLPQSCERPSAELPARRRIPCSTKMGLQQCVSV